MIEIAGLTLLLRVDYTAFMFLVVILAVGLLLTCGLVLRRFSGSLIAPLGLCCLNLIATTSFLLMFTEISWQQSASDQLKLYTQADTSVTVPLASDKYFHTASNTIVELANKLSDVNSVTIYGDGLSELQWQQLEALANENALPTFVYSDEETNFSPSLIGFNRASWQREIALGEPLIIELTLTKQPGETGLHQVKLFDPAQSLIGNQTVRMGDTITFETVPKSIGRWLYEVKLYSPDDQELVSEQVYVHVKPGISPNVLVVQAAPSFETRHLQNWLSDMNAQVRIETQISQNKFKQQSINVDAALVAQWQSPYSAGSLEWTDLLVIDMRSLRGLSSIQASQIESAVKQGLGVYIIADNTIVEVESLPLVPEVTQSLIQLSETNTSALPEWVGFSTRQPVNALKSRFTDIKNNLLVKDENDQGLVQVTTSGAGKIATSLFPSAYTWRIGGNRQIHSRYWQLILTEVGRRKMAPQWDLYDFSLIDSATSQMKLCLIAPDAFTDVNLGSQHAANQQALRLNQNLILEQQYCANYWQQQSGWHSLNIRDGDHVITDHVFLYPPDSWQALNQAHKRNATAKRIVAPEYNVNSSVKMVLPNWIIGLIWLLAMTLLWIEQRWSYNK